MNMLRKIGERPTVRLELMSGQRRSGVKVMAAFLAGAWLMDVMWFAVALLLFAYNQAWAYLMLFCVFAFGSYLTIETLALTRAMNKNFKLTVDDASISVMTDDNFSQSEQKIQSIEWKSIRVAEVYRYSDKASVVLSGDAESLEIPLWAFDAGYPEIVSLLHEYEIPVVLVP